MPSVSRAAAWLLLGLAYLLGCVSIGLFGVFLWHGAFSFVHLKLTAAESLSFDALLSLGFFLQHSGMIRRRFRARLARLLPEPTQPAFYAIASGAALLLFVVFWQPAPPDLFIVRGPWRWVMRAAFLAALAGMVWAFSSLRHFDPLGAGPLLARLRGQPELTSPLVIRGAYRWVRHPIYSCFLLMLWVSPDLTAGRLLLDVLWGAWIVVAARLEERDLVRDFGRAYHEYQRRVPMLLPYRLPPRG